MKSIVIYFSRADENYGVGVVDKGNTEIVAEYIKELVNADLFKVERKIPYAKDYQTCCDEAKEEQINNERPELTKYLDNIEEYDTVYIGSPIYWETMPQPMFTQLEKLNFNGKIVKPFTTHEGSGLGNVISDLQKICVGANIKDALAIKGTNAKDSKEIVEKWCRE